MLSSIQAKPQKVCMRHSTVVPLVPYLPQGHPHLVENTITVKYRRKLAGTFLDKAGICKHLHPAGPKQYQYLPVDDLLH